MSDAGVASAPDLAEPVFWRRSDAFEILADIRRLGAVHVHENPSEGRLWSVLSYTGAVQVLNDPEAFSSERGSLLGSGPAGPPGVGRMMALTDPPRHRKLRQPAVPFFSVDAVAQLRRRIAALAREIVTRALELQEVEFVRDVAAPLPTRIMCQITGVPQADEALVVSLCDEAFLGRTPIERSRGHGQLIAYLLEVAAERRRSPGEDLLSAFVRPSADGRDLPLEDVVLNADNIVVGGVQTVRHTMSRALETLICQPTAWTALRAYDVAGIENAVEELLRYTSAGLHTVRATKRAVDVEGTVIGPDERVVVWIAAANRDDAVFGRPDDLDLARRPNRHIAFGWGPHYCIGAALARAELCALISELARRVERVELLAEPVKTTSLIDFGLESLRVRLHPAATASRGRR